jgi:hypothetical protein
VLNNPGKTEGEFHFMQKHCWKIVELEPSRFLDPSKRFAVQAPDTNFRIKNLTFEEAEIWCEQAIAQVGEDLKALLKVKLKEFVKEHMAEFGAYYRRVFGMSGLRGLEAKAYDFTMELEALGYQLQRRITEVEYDYISSEIKPHILKIFQK